MTAAIQDTDRRSQYVLQLVQVFFVGLTLGMMRTVVPAVAESDFGVGRGDLALVSTFIIAFGVVKAVINFAAGAWSETLGRRRVLIAGWLIALPIPWMIWIAPAPPEQGGWGWIVAATVLLGANQGLTWTMTLTSKLDLTPPQRRGMTNGLNEFCGYFAVAVAGVVTAYLSDRMGARAGLLAFGLAVIIPALLMAVAFVRETRPSLVGETQVGGAVQAMTTREVIALSFRDRTFFALCQAGLFEKFIDVLAWLVLPLYLTLHSVDLKSIGWIPGIYAATWGSAQIITGPMSDRLGRKTLIVGGMLLCALGAAAFPAMPSTAWWSACAASMGLGMAMLYPTLGAAVSDLANDQWRASALGVYRCWRDLGYAAGAIAFGVLLALQWPLHMCFAVGGAVVGLSGLVVLATALETAPSRVERRGQSADSSA